MNSDRAAKLGWTQWPWLLAAQLLTYVGLALIFVRAVHAPIIIDEALTYEAFFAGASAHDVFRFGPNNHLLNTILVRLSTKIFGLSEWTMRMPAFVCAIVAFEAVNLISRRVLGPTVFGFLAVALVVVNPDLTSLMALARGYPGAMACYLCAVYVATLILQRRGEVEGDRKTTRLWILLASLCGLSMSFNLVAAYAVVPLGALLFGYLLWGKSTGPQPFVASVKTFSRLYLLPAAVVFLFLSWAFLSGFQKWAFHIGYPSPRDSVAELLFSTFFRIETAIEGQADMYGALGQTPGSYVLAESSQQLLGLIIAALVAIGFALVLYSVFLIVRGMRARKPLDESTLQLLLLVGLLSLPIALMVLARVFLHILFPVERTIAFLIPIFALAMLKGCEHLSKSGTKARVGLTLLATIVVATTVAAYVPQLGEPYHRIVEYDSSTRTAFRALEALPKIHQPLRVGASWVLSPSMEFYRQMFRATDRFQKFEMIQKDDPSNYDAYVINTADQKTLDMKELRFFAHDSTGKAALYVSEALEAAVKKDVPGPTR